MMDLWSAYFVYGGAAGMVVTLSLVIRQYKVYTLKNELTLRRLLWLIYILVAMAVMYGLATLYLIARTVYMLFIAIMVSNVVMVAWLLALAGNSGSSRPVRSRLSVIPIAVGVVASEYLMGLTYTIYLGAGWSRGDLILSLNSPWFVVPMALEASLTYVMVRPQGVIRRLAPLLILGMVFNPAMFNSGLWFNVSLYASSILMIVAIVVALDYLYRVRIVDGSDLVFLVGVMCVMALMMGVQFLGMLNPNYWAYYGLTLLIDMAWYIPMYLLSGSWRLGLTAWVARPPQLVAILGMLFVAEALMGGVLSIQWGFLNVQGLTHLLQFNPSIINDLLNILILVASLTDSPGFLIMMGAEMGWLVISRIRELRDNINRARYIAMFLAYWLYTVYAPTFLPPNLVRYPYVDWSMGLGTAGPLSLPLAPAIVGTYAINIILSLLFGSRQLCSVMCSAAYMWQGTFYNALKLSPLNPTRNRRGLLRIIRLVNGVLIYTLLGIFAYLSLANQLSLARFTIDGLDPLVFLYLMLFGVVWYVFFFLAPVLGTYNCVTYGWCHWGLLNQLVGKLGFFRLRVRDPQLCVKCPTKDCARACPVGNSNLPMNFIMRGYYKSSTCVGVGDCVEACPYGNIYMYDALTALRERIKRVKPILRGSVS